MGKASPHIGSLNEKPLHAALKLWYAKPRDEFEVSVDGFVIDIVRGKQLVEIQTKNFSSMKRKLLALTANHKVRLMYPIAREKWIVKSAQRKGAKNSRRKSPKRGRMDQVLEELVSFPKLLADPNFSLLVLLIQEEEVRHHDPKRSWRRKGWVTHERRLLDVVEQQLFESPEDMGAFIPSTLDETFTTLDLAEATERPRWIAQKMAYCLREMGVIKKIGFRNRGILYEKVLEGRRTVA